MSFFGQTGGGSSLFGSNNNNNPQRSTSLFGGSQPQSGGLFGSTASSQPAQSGGLFGSTAGTSQPQQSGGLFGVAPQPQNQTGSSLFGATAGQPQAQNNQQPPTGGLFGSNQPSQQQQPNGSSLFGGSLGQNQNQPAQSGGGLFGGSASAQNKPTLSLFGATAPINNQTQQTQPLQQQPSLFSPNANPLTSPPLGSGSRLPGTLTMGQSTSQLQQQQQHTVPGVRIDVSNLRGTTRFNDLHEDLQKQIEQIDLFIQQQISFKEQCDALMPAHEQNLSTIPSDVEFVKTKLETAELTLSNDSDAINAMKTTTTKDANDARVAFRAVENLKLPQQFQYSGIWRPTASTITPPRSSGSGDQTTGGSSSTDSVDLVSYFNQQTQELSKLLATYSNSVNEIETHLGAVEASAMAQSHQLMFRRGRDGSVRTKEEQVAELAAVLRQFESGILGVAGKVGQIREDVVDVIERDTQGGILGYRR